MSWRDIEGERHSGVRDHTGADFEAPGQLVNASSLNCCLMSRLLRPVIHRQIEGILLAEISIGIALARAIVLILRPDVIGEQLEMIGEALGEVYDQRLVVSVS